MTYQIHNIRGSARLAPQRFDHGGGVIGPLEFTCDLVDEHDRVLIVSMKGSNTGKGLVATKVSVAVTDDEDRIRTSDLRIPLDRILQAGARGAYLKVEERDGQRISTPISPLAAGPPSLPPLDQSHRRRYDDEHYKQVGDDYRTALADGDDPTEAVAQKHFLSKRQAGRHVREARDRGCLGEAIPGKAGELPGSDE